MLFDIQQSTSSDLVKISYINSKQKLDILEVPKNEFYKWDIVKGKRYDSEYKSFLGEKVLKKYYKNSSWHIDKFAIWEFINNLDEETLDEVYKFNIPKILFCDIETEVHDGKFPDVDIVKEKVTAISFAFKKDDKFYSYNFGYKEDFTHKQIVSMNKFTKKYFSDVTKNDIIVNYTQVKDERQLLTTFVKMCSKFHIITGWNFVKFDWTFLKNRMKKLGIDYSRMSPTLGIEESKNRLTNGNPYHFAILDYLEIFRDKDFTIKPKKSNSLEWISNAVLGIGKLKLPYDIQTTYEKDFYTYSLYCAIDTLNVLFIHEKCNTLLSLLAVSNKSCVEVKRCQKTTTVAEGLFAKYFLKHKLVIPTQVIKNVKRPYAGAYVRKPIEGIWKAVACYDFSSLYPNISRLLYLSPESFVKKMLPDYAETMPKDNTYDEYNSKYKTLVESLCATINGKPIDNYIISTSSAIFDKTSTCVLKEIYDDLYRDRKIEQKRYKISDIISNIVQRKIKDF